jgi:hypothetical protein
VEHDATEIWASQMGVAVEAMLAIGASAEDIAAIGITNQRETVVVWERDTGKPICHAIVWQCRRTASECDALKADGIEPMVRERTGLLIDPYFSASKLPEMRPGPGRVPQRTPRIRHSSLQNLPYPPAARWFSPRWTYPVPPQEGCCEYLSGSAGSGSQYPDRQKHR